MKVIAIIPARYESSRFPGKPLVDLHGKSMIERVCEQVSQASSISEFIVATDDDRIYRHCDNAKLPVIMTSVEHRSGTERVAEVAAGLDADIVVNVQGDEPFLDPGHLDVLIKHFTDDQIQIATLKSRISDRSEIDNPNVVKVVCDQCDQALYFSRSVIPFSRDNGEAVVFRHHGIYAYRRDVISDLVILKSTPLEEAEKLEQLRWMEHGFKILVAEVDGVSLAIDTPEDLDRALQYLKR